MPHAAESRRDYVRGMVELGLWYAHRLCAGGRTANARYRDVFSRHVDLYRLTRLFDGTRDVASGHHDATWDDCVATLRELARTTDTAAFVARGSELLAPLLSYEPEPTPAGAIGCWHGALVGDGIADGHHAPGPGRSFARFARAVRRNLGMAPQPTNLELHFFNAVAPASPFADPAQLAADLLQFVTRVRREHPEVQTVWCNSWLNDCARFVALFPPAWRARAVPRPIAAVDRESHGRARLNTRNWWGQFERADGTFHRVHAERFQAAGGVFPHACMLARAPIDDVESHLAKLVAQPRLEPAP